MMKYYLFQPIRMDPDLLELGIALDDINSSNSEYCTNLPPFNTFTKKQQKPSNLACLDVNEVEQFLWETTTESQEIRTWPQDDHVKMTLDMYQPDSSSSDFDCFPPSEHASYHHVTPVTCQEPYSPDPGERHFCDLDAQQDESPFGSPPVSSHDHRFMYRK